MDRPRHERHTVEFYSWVMGWGEKVEVLESEDLRDGVIGAAKAVMDV